MGCHYSSHTTLPTHCVRGARATYAHDDSEHAYAIDFIRSTTLGFFCW